MHKTGFTLVYFNFYLFFLCYLFSFFFSFSFSFFLFLFLSFDSPYISLPGFPFSLGSRLTYKSISGDRWHGRYLAYRLWLTELYPYPYPFSFILPLFLLYTFLFPLSYPLNSLPSLSWSFHSSFIFFISLLIFFFSISSSYLHSPFSLVLWTPFITPFYCHCYFFPQTSNSFAFFLPSLILLLAPTPFCLLIFPVFSLFFFLHNL